MHHYLEFSNICSVLWWISGIFFSSGTPLLHSYVFWFTKPHIYILGRGTFRGLDPFKWEENVHTIVSFQGLRATLYVQFRPWWDSIGTGAKLMMHSYSFCQLTPSRMWGWKIASLLPVRLWTLSAALLLTGHSVLYVCQALNCFVQNTICVLCCHSKSWSIYCESLLIVHVAFISSYR